MTSSNLKLEFQSNLDALDYTDGQIIPSQKIVMEIPNPMEYTAVQLSSGFSRFLQSMGYNKVSIMMGGCFIAFNECNDIEDMRKVASEYDLVLGEDRDKSFTKLVEENLRLNTENVNLKAKLSRLENPDNPNYTEEELEAMTLENV